MFIAGVGGAVVDRRVDARVEEEDLQLAARGGVAGLIGREGLDEMGQDGHLFLGHGDEKSLLGRQGTRGDGYRGSTLLYHSKLGR